MDIEKHLIITGTSEVSWKDAIVKAIAEASKSIDYLSSVKILEQNKRSVEKMNSENAFKQLGQKLMNGEITPEEHVKEYNRLLKEMSEKYDSQWRPHEHI